LLTGKTKLAITISNANLITITPISFTEVGTHSIKIILTDLCLNSISNDLIVVVTNTAPYFIVPTLPIYSTSLNTKKEILINQVKDNEGHTIVMTL
jgi:hypothetical protein